MDYAIWRACERLGILPPGVESRWEDMSAWEQAYALGYHHIRDYEEAKEFAAQMGAKL
jgi:hypothetical protein